MKIAESHQKNTKGTDQANASEIEGLLTYMALADDRSSVEVTWKKLNGSYFYGQQSNCAFHPASLAEFTSIAKSVTKWRGSYVSIIEDDLSPGDLFDVALCQEFNECESKLLAMHNLTTEAWRVNNARAIAVASLAITNKGTIEERYGSCVFKRNGVLIIPDHLSKKEAEFNQVFWANVVNHLYCVERFWNIQIRLEPGTPSIGFFTDPTGILKFLKFREKPDGKNRRDAVIHWVSEHWRENRHDPDAEIFVRRHLRGKSVQSWHGMEVKVVIPDAPKELDEKEERKRKFLQF